MSDTGGTLLIYGTVSPAWILAAFPTYLSVAQTVNLVAFVCHQLEEVEEAGGDSRVKAIKQEEKERIQRDSGSQGNKR